MNLKVETEYGYLKAVMIHRPAREIDRLTPSNVTEYLFEDIPFLPEMQAEHDHFAHLLRSSDAQVFRLTNLLTDVLQNVELRKKCLITALTEQSLEYLVDDVLAAFSVAECAQIMVSGLKGSEFKRKVKGRLPDRFGNRNFVVDPCPNAYFMRDPAAVIQQGVIHSSMRFRGRMRESFVLQTIFNNHPVFANSYKPIYPEEGWSIEGGDVIVLSPKALAIGLSERTDAEAVRSIAWQLLGRGQVERVYGVSLPKKRSFMHLDTVFSIIDENLVLSYLNAINKELETYAYILEGFNNDGKPIIAERLYNESLISILKQEIPYLDVIETGGGHPDYSAREQWFDGANVFPLGPRKVIAYSRNTHTIRALNEAGVETHIIPSAELYRGLGGPRCMTMTLERSTTAYL